MQHQQIWSEKKNCTMQWYYSTPEQDQYQHCNLVQDPEKWNVTSQFTASDSQLRFYLKPRSLYTYRKQWAPISTMCISMYTHTLNPPWIIRIISLHQAYCSRALTQSPLQTRCIQTDNTAPWKNAASSITAKRPVRRHAGRSATCIVCCRMFSLVSEFLRFGINAVKKLNIVYFLHIFWGGIKTCQ